MANHKGERECITCRFHVDTATRVFCQKYSSDILIKRGPYLICRLWQGYDGQTLNDAWRDKYLPREGVLYQHDIYMTQVPRLRRMLRVPGVLVYDDEHLGVITKIAAA